MEADPDWAEGPEPDHDRWADEPPDYAPETDPGYWAAIEYALTEPPPPRLAIVANEPSPGQAPPHNAEAEAAVLGACLTSAEARAEAGDLLDPGDFYVPAHGLVFEAVTALHASGAPVDVLTVTDRLALDDTLDRVGGTEGIQALIDAAPDGEAVTHYARIVIDRATMRRVIATGDTIARIGWEPTTDMEGALAEARSSIERLADRTTTTAQRLITGGTFIHDQPEGTPAIWGSGPEVLWAQGESLLLVGPTGVGKTTIAAQILEGLLTGGDLLGWPITPAEGRVLYLAMDRPSQIARALRRTLDHHPRETLDERLAVWRGPLPHDLGVRPETLYEIVHRVGASTVIVDSLKDAAVKLSNDEVGGNINRALQTCLAEGIDVLVSHHHRKAERGHGGEKTTSAPASIDELFGSALIPHGAGSVLQLWGAPGDLEVTLTQLKEPAEKVGPLKVGHDHDAGRSTITRGFDVLAALRNAPRGMTTMDVARLQFEIPHGEVESRLYRRAERRLKALEREGRARREGPERDNAGRAAERRWFAVDDRHGGDR